MAWSREAWVAAPCACPLPAGERTTSHPCALSCRRLHPKLYWVYLQALQALHEQPQLASSNAGRAAAQADLRAPDGDAPAWRLSADCEALAWAPHAPAQFLAACEDGLVAGYDARAGGDAPPLFRLAAHDKPACALAFCAAAPGLLATASTDKKARRALPALRGGRAPLALRGGREAVAGPS
jgi:hypothetical protein